MTIVAEQYTHVVGVDTHARIHTLSVLAATTGAVIGTDTFPTTGAGTSRAVEWIRRRTPTGNVPVAVEGTSSYEARLTRLLEVERFAVCEARPPRRQSRRAHGKSDSIDAVAAARTDLGTATTELVSPRAEGLREALRILLAARRSMDTQRTGARNALTALLRAIDLGIDARSPLTAAQVTMVQGWRARQGDGAAAAVARADARHLASAVITLGTELEDNQRALAEHVQLMAPGNPGHLRGRPGGRGDHPGLVLAPRQGPLGSGLRGPRRCRHDPGILWQHETGIGSTATVTGNSRALTPQA